MLDAYATDELFIMGFGGAVILWALYRIFTAGRFGKTFSNWLLILVVAAALWLWRSGQGLEAYQYIKSALFVAH